MESAKSPHRHIAQLRRLFEREPSGWGRRSLDCDLRAIADYLAGGRIAISAIRLPRPATPPVLKLLEARTSRNESLEHVFLKWAAVEWMRLEGVNDAIHEVFIEGARCDVYSRNAHWAIECGNTNAAGFAQMALRKRPPRFSLIPFQAGMSRIIRDLMFDRKPKWPRIMAFDFRAIPLH